MMPLLLSMIPVAIQCGLSSLVHLVMTMLKESAAIVMAMSMFLVRLLAVSSVILI